MPGARGPTRRTACVRPRARQGALARAAGGHGVERQREPQLVPELLGELTRLEPLRDAPRAARAETFGSPGEEFGTGRVARA
jgi:hypothetical protein